MTLDWAARWSKLHQFLYAGAPICPCTSPIESSHIDSTARSGKFAHGRNKQDFPQAPTYLRWLASRPACRAHSVDAAFADPAKPTPFWGGGGLFLILLSSLSDNCRSPSKGRVQDTPAVHCGWWSPRHARRWSRWRSHQMAPAALVVWLAVSVVAFRSGLATTPKST